MPLLIDTKAPQHAKPTGIHWVRLASVASLLLAGLCVGVGLIWFERTFVPSANVGVVGVLVIIADLAVAKDALKAAAL